MSRNACYAGECEIVALSRLLNVNIVVHTTKRVLYYFAPTPRHTVYLKYFGDHSPVGHYEPFHPAAQSCQAPQRPAPPSDEVQITSRATRTQRPAQPRPAPSPLSPSQAARSSGRPAVSRRPPPLRPLDNNKQLSRTDRVPSPPNIPPFPFVHRNRFAPLSVSTDVEVSDALTDPSFAPAPAHFKKQPTRSSARVPFTATVSHLPFAHPNRFAPLSVDADNQVSDGILSVISPAKPASCYTSAASPKLGGKRPSSPRLSPYRLSKSPRSPPCRADRAPQPLLATVAYTPSRRPAPPFRPEHAPRRQLPARACPWQPPAPPLPLLSGVYKQRALGYAPVRKFQAKLTPSTPCPSSFQFYDEFHVLSVLDDNKTNAEISIHTARKPRAAPRRRRYVRRRCRPPSHPALPTDAAPAPRRAIGRRYLAYRGHDPQAHGMSSPAPRPPHTDPA